MASTYTDNSGIEKPGTGDQSGTWGDTTNTNFDIIDRVLSGVGTISLSGTTHTLTTTDGALSDGHYRVLVLGGSPTGTNTITLSPNDQDKLYFVHNTSGEDATFTQGSGSNVTVPNGHSKIIYADGAGSGAAVNDLTSLMSLDTLTLNGTDVTSTAAELNILDGVTATTAQLNIMDGVTSTTAELNILNGVTATTAELNLVDGSTAGTVVNSKAVIYSSAGEVVGTTVTGDTLTVNNGSNDWTVTVTSNKLLFKYAGTNKMELDTSGNLKVTGDVTAFGTIS